MKKILLPEETAKVAKAIDTISALDAVSLNLRFTRNDKVVVHISLFSSGEVSVIVGCGKTFFYENVLQLVLVHL